MIEKIGLIFLLAELALLAVQDYRKKRISVIVLLAMMAGGIAFRLVGARVGQAGFLQSEFIIGMIFGCGMVMVGKLTNGIGVGDGLVILLITLMSNGVMAVGVFLLAMTIAAMTAAMLLAAGKVKRKYEMPFIPFLFFSTLGVWVCM